jgi:hypothetical protein
LTGTGIFSAGACLCKEPIPSNSGTEVRRIIADINFFIGTSDEGINRSTGPLLVLTIISIGKYQHQMSERKSLLDIKILLDMINKLSETIHQEAIRTGKNDFGRKTAHNPLALAGRK